jgi:hypothetical protein
MYFYEIKGWDTGIKLCFDSKVLTRNENGYVLLKEETGLIYFQCLEQKQPNGSIRKDWLGYYENGEEYWLDSDSLARLWLLNCYIYDDSTKKEEKEIKE